MPTVIKIKTYMCENGIGNPLAECRFHCSVEEFDRYHKCPICTSSLQEAKDPEDQITVTIRDIEDEDTDEIKKKIQRDIEHYSLIKA